MEHKFENARCSEALNKCLGEEGDVCKGKPPVQEDGKVVLRAGEVSREGQEQHHNWYFTKLGQGHHNCVGIQRQTLLE